MDTFSRNDLNTLIEERTGPCVSIYTFTHKGNAPENLIRWQHQLDDAEKRLIHQGMRAFDANELLLDARKLLKDQSFWKSMSEGLITFVAPKFHRIYRLPMTLENQVFTMPRFQVKPLLPWLLSDGHYYLLTISQNQVRLYEGSAHRLHRLDPNNIPNKKEALKTHDRDEILTLHTHSDSAGKAMHAVFHGQGVGIDDQKTELLQFCQKIDKAIHAMIPSGTAPLVLATVDYLHAIYARANKYGNLVSEGISGNPDHWNEQQLHEKSWAIVAPLFQNREAQALKMYQQEIGKGRTLDEIGDVVRAAYRNELDSVFLVPGQTIWGRYTPEIDLLERHPDQLAGDEDLVNLVATLALRHHRPVHFVEPKDLFEKHPMAGLSFYPMAKHSK